MRRYYPGQAAPPFLHTWVTNFIIFRLKDRKQTEDVSALVVSMLADKFEVILREAENKISALVFFGNDFGIVRLGYIVVPYLLRHKISDVKNNRLKLENGPYPPRKDGGYGWFMIACGCSSECSQAFLHLYPQFR